MMNTVFVCNWCNMNNQLSHTFMRNANSTVAHFYKLFLLGRLLCFIHSHFSIKKKRVVTWLWLSWFSWTIKTNKTFFSSFELTNKRGISFPDYKFLSNHLVYIVQRDVLNQFRQNNLKNVVVRVWVFWIRCSSPFQAKQLGRDITKTVRIKI